jgi:hypothetical protein
MHNFCRDTRKPRVTNLDPESQTTNEDLGLSPFLRPRFAQRI